MRDSSYSATESVDYLRRMTRAPSITRALSIGRASHRILIPLLLVTGFATSFCQSPMTGADSAYDIASHRRPRLGVYAGIVGDAHVNVVLTTEPEHGIELMDAAGLGYRAGVQTTFELGESWDLVPHLGFASWSAHGRRSDVLADALVRAGSRNAVDSLVNVDITVDLAYRMIEIGMIFEATLQRFDSVMTMTFGIGPAVSVVVGSVQEEAFEVGRSGGYLFVAKPGTTVEDDGARVVYWSDEINRRAFVRMSGIATLSLTRQLSKRTSLRGALAFNVPLTSVVELTDWRVFGASLNIGVQWTIDDAQPQQTITPP